MIRWKIRVKFERPPDLVIRQWRVITREAHRRVGRHWFEVMLPRHFERDAHSRYGYQERNKRYMIQKAKSGHGNIDLVYSRKTMEMVMGGTPLIRGFPSRVRIDLNSPDYVKMRPWASGPNKNPRPALGAEIAAVTYEESRELAAVLVREMESLINQVRDSRVIDIEQWKQDWSPSTGSWSEAA